MESNKLETFLLIYLLSTPRIYTLTDKFYERKKEDIGEFSKTATET